MLAGSHRRRQVGKHRNKSTDSRSDVFLRGERNYEPTVFAARTGLA